MKTTLEIEMLDGVEEELMARAFLFGDPTSYRDGVGAATQAVRAMMKVGLLRRGDTKPGKETP